MATFPTLGNAPENRVPFAASNREPGRRVAENPTPTLFPTVPPHRDTEQLDREASEPFSGSAPNREPAPGRPGRAVALVGIARLAASSPLQDAKRGTEYYLLPVRSILNRCDSERVPFAWTVNPYRGCEFGCRYCYARYTHEYMELDGGEFESKIYIKQDAAAVAARDLATEDVWGKHIAIGTATDPYQPAEQQFGVTRAILEQMAAREGLSVSITTKSNQVLRDVDVLRRIAARSALAINITVTTLRTRLARLLEPRAPRPDLRLQAVRTLREAGLAAGVFAMPVLPGLTDGEEDLDALARAARDAGAQWFAASVLFLMPSAQKQFLPFLEEKFPKLARKYRAWYACSAYPPEAYRREIAERVARLRAHYGLGARPHGPERLAWRSPQLPLALDAGGDSQGLSRHPAHMNLRSCACAR